jgi:hypothetical protein
MTGGRRSRAVRAWLLVPAVLLAAGVALADEAESNRAVATDLFDAGVRKMAEGKCDENPIADRAACNEARDAFKRAYALYPAGLGALRNLAYVEQNLGLIASAARDFRELMRRAPLDPNPARRLWAEFAQKEFDALAPRIPRLTIEVAERPAELTLSLDDNPLPEAAWGTPLELDPGAHTLRAKAPGHATFETSFELKEREKKQISVVLEKQAESAAAAAAPAPETRPAPSPDVTPKRSRLLPLVVTGAGVVVVGVGLGLGYVAIKKRDDACGDGNFCEPDGLESGRSTARASTIVTGVGAATVAGGLIWYFLSAPARPAQPSARLAPEIGRTGGGIRAYGTF